MQFRFPLAAIIAASFTLLVFPAVSQVLDYSFEDPKGINSIGISLDGKLEFIKGTASGIKGTVKFDPKQPKTISGEIIVDAKSIQMTSSLMTKHLHGEDWLNVTKYPTIKAVLTRVVSVKKRPANKFNLVVEGSFTLKGITKKIKIPVSISFQPDQLKVRNHKGDGHLLVVSTKFQVDRHDFNIKPEMDGTIVSRNIQLDVGIVGFAKKN